MAEEKSGLNENLKYKKNIQKSPSNKTFKEGLYTTGGGIVVFIFHFVAFYGFNKIFYYRRLPLYAIGMLIFTIGIIMTIIGYVKIQRLKRKGITDEVLPSQQNKNNNTGA